MCLGYSLKCKIIDKSWRGEYEIEMFVTSQNLKRGSQNMKRSFNLNDDKLSTSETQIDRILLFIILVKEFVFMK